MKNIVIIGASASIGSAILARFRSAASQIVATYCLNDRIRAEESIYPMFLDLTNDESIQRFANELGTLMSYIDTVIFLTEGVSIERKRWGFELHTNGIESKSTCDAVVNCSYASINRLTGQLGYHVPS